MKLCNILTIAISAGTFALLGQSPAMAESLKISPLHYDVQLTAGETKKGFVDITNPTASAEMVVLSVSAFLQIDNNGSLEFYNDPDLKNAVKLDYDEVEIGARETLHLAFSVASTRLPSGNVFAAIMAATKPQPNSAATPAARVGSLLFIKNGELAGQNVAIEQLNVPAFQFGEALSAHFAVRNADDKKEGTGFFPKITVSVWPFVNDTVAGPLVFPGITRQVDYVKRGSYFGIVKYTIKSSGSLSTAYSFVVTGYWRGIVPIVLLVLAGSGFVALRMRRRASNNQ